MTRVIIAAFALAFAASPLPAAAADPAPAHTMPRTLVFKVEYSEHSEQRTATSGLGNSDFSGHSSTPSSSTDRSQTSAGADGTVKADVVAVTGDGIVIDISESAPGQTRAPARIGVALDGRLVYDPAKADLSPAEVEILQFLNRALVTGHDADGAAWTVSHDVAKTKDSTEYRIVSSEPGPILHIELQRTLSAAVGGHPLDMTESGTVRYDEVKTIPLDAALRARRTTHQTGQVTTVDSTLTFRLLSDSWHPKT